jgi:hypothetical protein
MFCVARVVVVENPRRALGTSAFSNTALFSSSSAAFSDTTGPRSPLFLEVVVYRSGLKDDIRK